MSILSSIHTFWAANPFLTAVIPATSLYTWQVPTGTDTPYAVLTPIASPPTWTTGDVYMEDFSFQIAVYDDDLDTCDALARVIEQQLDFKKINFFTTVQLVRENKLYSPMETSDLDTIYGIILEYTLTVQRSQLLG